MHDHKRHIEGYINHIEMFYIPPSTIARVRSLLYIESETSWKS